MTTVWNVEQRTFGSGGCLSLTRTVGMAREDAERLMAKFKRSYPRDRFRLVAGINKRGRFVERALKSLG